MKLLDYFLSRFRSISVWIFVSAAFVTLVASSAGLKIWRYDLRSPLNYSGDALYESVLVKGLCTRAWNNRIENLGAPFGMDTVDFPIGCTLDFAVMKVMSFVVHNPFLLINLFWLLTIVGAGAFAALFLRALQITPLNCVVFGALYGIIPFVFYRNVGHLSLVHYIVPAAAYLGLVLARGQFGAADENAAQTLRKSDYRLSLIFCCALAAAIGLTVIYWAFFACIVISVGTVIGLSRVRSKLRHLLSAAVLVGVIGISSAADISASFVYWKKNGWNAALNYKNVAEADIYGLKVRQLLNPITNHPLSLFRTAHQKLEAAHFPNDDNESATAVLGLIGSLGFLLLLFIVISRPERGLIADQRLRILAGLVMGVVVIASVGGFGSLFNVFVMHEFRAYNRISPFISLFSLAAAAIAMDAWTRRWAAPATYSLAGALVILGIFDQADPAFLSDHAANTTRFIADRTFIRQLETILPAGAMVFQLPHTGFPPDTNHERMGPYENSRAYLNSETLRWSWGSMDGRHGNWAEATARLPVDQSVQRLVASGFEGVLLDRFGVRGTEVEQGLTSELGAQAQLLANDRWVYFDLRQRRIEFEKLHPRTEVAQWRDLALHPPVALFLDKFSVPESSEIGNFRWCGRTGIIHLTNVADVRQEVDVTATLRHFGAEPASLSVEIAGRLQHISLPDSAVPFRERIILQAHGVAEIHFSYSGNLVNAPEDARELAFQIQNFSLEPSREVK